MLLINIVIKISNVKKVHAYNHYTTKRLV